MSQMMYLIRLEQVTGYQLIEKATNIESDTVYIQLAMPVKSCLLYRPDQESRHLS